MLFRSDLPSSAYRLPPLSSVRQSIGELGDRSAQAILQLIAGRRPRFNPPPVELVIRESTDRSPGNGRGDSDQPAGPDFHWKQKDTN